MSNGKGGGGDSRPWVQLMGHVHLVTGYAFASFTGCGASITLKNDGSRTIWLLTSEHRLQTLLETALATGNQVAALAQARSIPSDGPLAGYSGEMFDLSELTLYGKP